MVVAVAVAEATAVVDGAVTAVVDAISLLGSCDFVPSPTAGTQSKPADKSFCIAAWRMAKRLSPSCPTKNDVVGGRFGVDRGDGGEEECGHGWHEMRRKTAGRTD